MARALLLDHRTGQSVRRGTLLIHLVGKPHEQTRPVVCFCLRVGRAAEVLETLSACCRSALKPCRSIRLVRPGSRVSQRFALTDTVRRPPQLRCPAEVSLEATRTREVTSARRSPARTTGVRGLFEPVHAGDKGQNAWSIEAPAANHRDGIATTICRASHSPDPQYPVNRLERAVRAPYPGQRTCLP